ncbi:MAG: DUF126 domain-containing protein [Ectothiorhodospiraceae bacterium]|nr:DUF126 domain-containing protein [Ectothiorhodospiraceae bacterium]
MEDRVFYGHVGIGKKVSGVALVAKDNFSARYDLDREKGLFSRSSHRLHGESYVGKIVILETAKGGVATAWMLAEMKSRGMAPAGLVLNLSNPVIAQGAAFAELSFIDRFAVDITSVVRSGELVTLNPQSGCLVVHAERTWTESSAGM